MQLSLNLQLLKKRGKHQSEHLSRFDSLLPVRQWVTWIRSKSCLLASSIFLKLFSTSLVLSTSFFICLMYSTDARSMVPLFQRTSLRRRHSFQILPLLFLVFFLILITGITAKYTHRSLVLGIMLPSSFIRSLMLNLLLLSTIEEKRRQRKQSG